MPVLASIAALLGFVAVLASGFFRKFLQKTPKATPHDLLSMTKNNTQEIRPDLSSLLKTAEEINDIISGDILIRWDSPFKDDCARLTNTVKLLLLLLKELSSSSSSSPSASVPSPSSSSSSLSSPSSLCGIAHCDLISSLHVALASAKELLDLCLHGSRIYLVLERDTVAQKFGEMTTWMDQALNNFTCNNADISEAREQLRRAQLRVDIPTNIGLYVDLSVVLSGEVGIGEADKMALRRVSEKLCLQKPSELEQESEKLHLILSEHNGDPVSVRQMLTLLRRLESSAITDCDDSMEAPKESEEECRKNRGPPAIPDDFRCPISLDLMRDPVIVASGQTYERSCIKKWLDAGNKTCPKTRQMLPQFTLTPNYALKSLISEWCVAQGIGMGERADPRAAEAFSVDQKVVEALVRKLGSGEEEAEREATAELRLLSRRSTENRVLIAECNAIPQLVWVLAQTRDARTEENAVTALLNLSICESNKRAIVAAGAVAPVVETLWKGVSMEARENAAAALFSLSAIDEHKLIIGGGTCKVFPPLVRLFGEGTLRGKKDAAAALFNLCTHRANKGRAIRAGVAVPLLRELTDPDSEMKDEALAVIAVLASHPEGRAAFNATHVVDALARLISSGSTMKNKENAVFVLLTLCSFHSPHVALVWDLGAWVSLKELAQIGSTRAQRKSQGLLDLLDKYKQEQEQEQELEQGGREGGDKL